MKSVMSLFGNVRGKLRDLVLTAFVSSVMFVDPAFAAAAGGGVGGFAKVQTTMDRIQSLLVALGVTVVTIAIMWAGYKISFQGARFQDVTGILIGGTLIGGSAAFAGFIVN
jgi:type IV secretion system protein VirB2